MDDCDIFINDQIMSKRHCTFQYMPGPLTANDLASHGPKEAGCSEGHWVLKDGYATGSLNGTWVYMS